MNNLNITNTLIKAGANLDTQASMLINQWTALHFGKFFNLNLF
jgi:hypothetical protein